MPRGAAWQGSIYSLTRFDILARLLPFGLMLVKFGKLRLLAFDLTAALCLGFRLASSVTHGGHDHRLRELRGERSEVALRPKHAACMLRSTMRTWSTPICGSP
jgi:hypothetical protein